MAKYRVQFVVRRGTELKALVSHFYGDSASEAGQKAYRHYTGVEKITGAELVAEKAKVTAHFAPSDSRGM